MVVVYQIVSTKLFLWWLSTHVYFLFFENKVISTLHIFYILMFPHPKWFVTGPVADNIS